MGSGRESNVRTEIVGENRRGVGGLTGWLLARLARGHHRATPRLALVERITLAPRQSLALIEAEGRRILVATSADGASAFYPLDKLTRSTAECGERPVVARSSRPISANASRVSW